MRASFFLAVVAAIVAAGSVIHGIGVWNHDPATGPAAAMFVLLFFALPALLAAGFFGSLGLFLRSRARRARASAESSDTAPKRSLGFWLIRIGMSWAVTAVVANAFFMFTLSAIMPGVETSAADILLQHGPGLMLKAVPGLLMASLGYLLDARAGSRSAAETA